MAESEFRVRLEWAQCGQLRSSRQIKAVDTRREPPLFEIRWQGISIREVSKTGRMGSNEILVRMYHSEPATAPGYFIGHHIHRKVILTPEETKFLQNIEIGKARSIFEKGIPFFWGIPELQKL